MQSHFQDSFTYRSEFLKAGRHLFVYSFIAFLCLAYGNSQYSSAAGQCRTPSFNAPSVFSSGTNPISVASGDLNSDGSLDLVVANLTTDTFSILFGDGAGGFLPPRSFDVGIKGGTVGAYPRAVAIGDLNADGKPDLIVAGGYANGWVSLLLGNGAGQFGPAFNQATGNGANLAVVLGDFNGDGKKDVATAGGDSYKITFLLGNGAGGFSSTSQVTVTSTATSIVAGDLNGDGLTDVVTGNSYFSWGLTVVLGRNDGNFVLSQSITERSQPQSLALADFNGDGRLDLAVAFGWADYGVEIRLGDPAGSFGPVVNTIFTPYIPQSVLATDLNNDGKADLLVDVRSTSAVGAFLGLGNGQFNLARYSGTLPDGLSSLVAGDFNLDGKKDVVGVSYNANQLVLLLGDGTGAYAAPTVIANQNQRGVRIAVADFNGDGRPDLATAGGYTNDALIYLNDGMGGITEALSFGVGSYTASIVTGDFNHDGKTDLVIGHDVFQHYVSVMIGNGSGGFTGPTNVVIGGSSISMVVGNFDADSNPDLAVVSDLSSGSKVVILHGDGVGSFGAPVIAAAGSAWIDTGDINGDGKADLVAGTPGANSINVLIGDGLGGFNPASYSPVQLPGGFNYFRVSDVDKNGRPDIVAMQPNASQISVLLNNAAGFDAPKITGGILAPQAVAIGDFNGDTNPDLAVTTNSYPGNIAVLSGDGLGNFSSPLYFTAGATSSDIAVGDFNGDGRPDLATPNYAAILLNTFQVLPCLSIGDSSVTEGDANSVSADFTVTLSAPSAQTVRVNYQLTGATAMAGTDFTLISDRLVFQPGEVTKSISVPITGDLLDEADETFKVLLSNPAAAAISDGEGAGTIVDNDPTPPLKVNDITVTEGGNSLFWNFTVSLSAVSGRDVTVQYATTDGTATSGTQTAGDDYFGTSGTLTIPAGQLQATRGVTVFGDNTFEPNETFFMNLSNPTNATIEDGQGRATIPNDDPQPSITIDDLFVSEGDPSAGSAAFLVRLSNPSSQSIMVAYTTMDVTATAGTDYLASSGTLVFNPGETSKSITVPVYDDSVIEPMFETFLLKLSNPVNATLANSQATGSIVDDDTPIFNFNGPNYNVSEGSGFGTVTVVRSGGVNTPATVDYATSDGTANQRTRYTTAVGTLSFAVGETTKSFTVLVTDALYVDGNQTVNLTLSNPTGTAVLGNRKTARLTIIDNDTTQPATNPLDNQDAQFFVRQHYYDFLNRIPDPGGLGFWAGQITQCGSDQICLRKKRIDVSNAFFYELEYQQTGSYVYRLYRAAFGNNQPFPNPIPDSNHPGEEKKVLAYSVFGLDRARVVGGSDLAKSQLDLANGFVLRPEFLARYPASLDGPGFVDAVLATIRNDIGADLATERPALITLFNSGGRGAVMYRLADDNAQNPINNHPFIDAEYNGAFVATQYFGYLRRDPDMAGFLFWLGQVGSAPLHDVTKQHAMVCSFTTSTEYQLRFSSVVTHSNSDCQ